MTRLHPSANECFRHIYQEFETNVASKSDSWQVMQETVRSIKRGDLKRSFSKESVSRALSPKGLYHGAGTVLGIVGYTFKDLLRPKEYVEMAVMLTFFTIALYPVYRVQKYLLRESARKKGFDFPNKNAA